jgi:origin recognition complex subunit 5
VTSRHLLERTTAAIHHAISADTADGDEASYNPRCENISALVVHLQRLLKGGQKFVLVFDGVDKQRDAPPTLLPALARLGEYVCKAPVRPMVVANILLQVPDLTTVVLVQHPTPFLLHHTGIPHLYFPPYSRDQSIHIVSLKPPDIFTEAPPPELEYDDEVHEEDKAWLWPRFCAAVWDSLGQNVARDLVSFREVCDRLWRPFVAPIVKGEFGTRDFSRLLVHQRKLFQDEKILLDNIITTVSQPSILSEAKAPELPYYSKWLLIAAYLASFNPAKLDAIYFMKASERKRKKKGGGTARSGGRPSQNRKIPRHLLAPSQFTLDRLLSILHAILPHDLRTTIDIYTQISTLSMLKLLTRGTGIGSADPLEPGSKWRVGAAVTWEYVQSLARGLKFDVADYVAE